MTERLRIVHLCPTGNWAGTEQMVSQMANAVADSHEVTVCLLDTSPLSPQELRTSFDPRVSIVEIPASASPGERAHVLASRVHEPDLVHAHLRPGLDIARMLPWRAPRLGHAHVRFFSAQFFDIDAVACVSRWQMDDIPPSFTGPSFHCPNWIVPFDTASDADLDAFRRRHRIDGRGVTIGAVGRLSEEKGMDLLIEAFLTMSERETSQLVILGDGPQLERLESLAASDPRIVFCGYVPAARRYLDAFDVFANCSRLESFGMSLLEAMSKSKPIVSTAARGPAEILSGQPATVVPIDDRTALTEALDSAVRARRAGEAAPVYDLSAYAPAVGRDKLLSAYEQLVTALHSRTHSGRTQC